MLSDTPIWIPLIPQISAAEAAAQGGASIWPQNYLCKHLFSDNKADSPILGRSLLFFTSRHLTINYQIIYLNYNSVVYGV